ncbi:MAG: 16S rRNA (cytosine(1402)-N(4))-methyltransferase RsmH [Actinomycetota bacterium]|nr:16S rRNA (cytosine(1402)-N(4))-methyltransferase RsmH [Actinomycetota bacterium]
MAHEPEVARGALHLPVMVDRVVELLAVPEAGPEQPVLLVDATVGVGGHAAALLAASGEGLHLVGFDRDPEALALARRRLAAYGGRVTLVHAAYDRLVEHVSAFLERVGPLLAVLYDLGMSSLQLDRAGRGFSFRADGPLDMRMDPTGGTTAADLVNDTDADELTGIIAAYGEERHARRIAAAIVRARPVARTVQLADVVAAALPPGERRRRTARGIHPATRTFQALRIAVNDELDVLGPTVDSAIDLLGPGGRLVVLAYHSGEDRIVKDRFLAAASGGCQCPPGLPCGCGAVPVVRLLNRGARTPSAAEVAANPRSESARLRACERLPASPDDEGRRP